jgi:4'-phosphopantetheinyl transferase
VIFPSFHPPIPVCFCWQVSNFGQPIAFNVSHDNELVAMAFAPGHHAPPAFLIGVDVMMVQAPTRGAEQGTALFLRTVGDTTVSGRAILVS